MDLDDIDRLSERHPAWRLMRARNAPLVLSFLGQYFIENNRGAAPSGHLVSALDDYLYDLHRTDSERYTANPAAYLDDWAAAESGWLRRYYPVGSEEVHYEATPALQKAYGWVESLRTRSFIGTESRLQTVVELLRQIVRGSETDPDSRIAELERRSDALDAELVQARLGNFAVLDDAALRDRYQQVASTARELLNDFRELEENFRTLDRSAREKIASWDGGKGELLNDLVSSRTVISSSDQGRSFQAFYDYLLSDGSQNELTELLATVQSMPQIVADRRLRTVNHDWSDAAERTQRTVRTLSEQLRRFLDDQVWVENKRVMDLVRSVEAAALAVRESPPRELGLAVDEPGVPIALPLERPLYDPQPAAIVDSMLSPDEIDIAELDDLFAQRFVDTARLANNIRAIVPPRTTAALVDIIALYPVQDGVAEILGYLSLDDGDITIDVGDDDTIIEYANSAGEPKRVRMRKIMVTRT